MVVLMFVSVAVRSQEVESDWYWVNRVNREKHLDLRAAERKCESSEAQLNNSTTEVLEKTLEKRRELQLHADLYRS